MRPGNLEAHDYHSNVVLPYQSAATDTTRNTISGSIYALEQAPESVRQLRANSEALITKLWSGRPSLVAQETNKNTPPPPPPHPPPPHTPPTPPPPPPPLLPLPAPPARFLWGCVDCWWGLVWRAAGPHVAHRHPPELSDGRQDIKAHGDTVAIC